jgi:hypothetical protein
LSPHADFIDSPRQRHQRGVARVQPVDFQLREIADHQLGRSHPIAVPAIRQGRQSARDELHERGFAGPVAPQDADAFARVHRAVHASNDDTFAVAGRGSVEGHQRLR